MTPALTSHRRFFPRLRGAGQGIAVVGRLTTGRFGSALPVVAARSNATMAKANPTTMKAPMAARLTWSPWMRAGGPWRATGTAVGTTSSTVVPADTDGTTGAAVDTRGGAGPPTGIANPDEVGTRAGLSPARASATTGLRPGDVTAADVTTGGAGFKPARASATAGFNPDEDTNDGDGDVDVDGDSDGDG